MGWRTLRKQIFEENISFDRRLQLAMTYLEATIGDFLMKRT